jgi:hypothetical protein
VGFAIAIPVTLAGLALTAATPGGALAESPQPSVLFLLLSKFFPLPGPVVQHPLAFAGWVGLFVTAINLLPAGQLDGGHVARALLGRRQFYLSWAAVLLLFGLSFVAYPGWFVFGFLIFILGVRHPPPLNDLTPLDTRRKLIGIAAVVILIITFVPQPFLTTGAQRSLAFEAVNGTREDQVNATIALATAITLTFAVNNTGLARETVVISLRLNNLDRVGFAIRFTSYRIGGVNHSANPDTLTVRLNPSERAVIDLLVTTPPSWPTALPADVTFQVHATTPDLVAHDLQVGVRVTR